MSSVDISSRSSRESPIRAAHVDATPGVDPSDPAVQIPLVGETVSIVLVDTDEARIYRERGPGDVNVETVSLTRVRELVEEAVVVRSVRAIDTPAWVDAFARRDE